MVNEPELEVNVNFAPLFASPLMLAEAPSVMLVVAWTSILPPPLTIGAWRTIPPVPASNERSPPLVSMTVLVSLDMPMVNPLPAMILTFWPDAVCTTDRKERSSVSWTVMLPLAVASSVSASTLTLIPPLLATRTRSLLLSFTLLDPLLIAPAAVRVSLPVAVTLLSMLMLPDFVVMLTVAAVELNLTERLFAFVISTDAPSTLRLIVSTFRSVKATSLVASIDRVFAVMVPPTVRASPATRVKEPVPALRAVPMTRFPPGAFSETL